MDRSPPLAEAARLDVRILAVPTTAALAVAYPPWAGEALTVNEWGASVIASRDSASHEPAD